MKRVQGIGMATKFLRSQCEKTFVGCAGQRSLIYGSPTLQSTGIEGSGANIFIPDTTAHLQRSNGIHVWVGQSCFGGIIRTYTILG